MNSFMKKRSSKPSPTNLTKPLLKCRVIKNPLKFILLYANFYSFYQHQLQPNTTFRPLVTLKSLSKNVKHQSANKCKYLDIQLNAAKKKLGPVYFCISSKKSKPGGFNFFSCTHFCLSPLNLFIIICTDPTYVTL